MVSEEKSQRLSFPVMEIFYSIQGEGFHQGKPAGFVRLAGCDVGCHWCDVKESWKTDTYPLLSPAEIGAEVAEYPSDMTIITGGEPVMYNLDALTDTLKRRGKKIHLETSGAYALSGNWDWITLSPKKSKKPLNEYFLRADELKVIVYNRSDIKWAEELAGKVKKECKLFLQPEWGNTQKIMPLILEYIGMNPVWRISLQVHKYLGVR